MENGSWRKGKRMKAQLRQQFKAYRESLPRESVTSASTHICDRLAAWLVLRRASTVMTYVAFRNELDLRALLELLPEIRWAVPRVEGPYLIPHHYDPGRLIRHRFGMLEPAPDLPVIAPREIDLVLVPGVAFDRRGGRLGFGGGFYDRFLPTTPALRVGVNYDACLVDELPVYEHDQRVDWVATPTQQLRCTQTMASGQP